MLPKKGLNMKFTDRFISRVPSYVHLKDKKLTILKLDIASLSGSNPRYRVFYLEGGRVSSIIVDAGGCDVTHGVDVFESFIGRGTVAPIFMPGFNIGGDDDDDDMDESELDEYEEAISMAPEPRNNDGRKTCFWCGTATKSCPGFFSSGDICPVCNK